MIGLEKQSRPDLSADRKPAISRSFVYKYDAEAAIKVLDYLDPVTFAMDHQVP